VCLTYGIYLHQKPPERDAPVSCHEYLSTMRVWKSCEGVAEQWQ